MLSSALLAAIVGETWAADAPGTFDAEVQEILDLRRAGKFAEAAARALQAATTFEEARGVGCWEAVDARRLAEDLQRIAALPEEVRADLADAERWMKEAEDLTDAGSFLRAEPHLRNALAVRQRHLGEKHRDTATSLAKLASCLLWLEKHDESGDLAERALALRRELLGEEHLETASSYAVLGLRLQVLGRYREAAAFFEKQLDVNRRLRGDEHPGTGKAYVNVAVNLKRLGRHAEAEPLFRKSLEIHTRHVGEEHDDTMACLAHLGVVLQEQGKNAQAEPLLRRALRFAREKLGAEQLQTAYTCQNLAACLIDQGKLEESEGLLREAVAILEKVLGKENSRTRVFADSLAINLRLQGKHADAEELARDLVERSIRASGPDHPDAAAPLTTLAGILDEQDRYAEAEPLHRRSVELLRRQSGEDDPSVRGSLLGLAWNLCYQGRETEAEPILRRILDVETQLSGESSPRTFSPAKALARALYESGRHDEAAGVLRRLLDAQLRIDPQDPTTVKPLNDLAANLVKQDRYAESAVLLEQAIQTHAARLPAVHPVAATLRMNLAGSLYAQGRFEAAGAQAERAIEILKSVSGGLHPEMTRSYTLLAATSEARGDLEGARRSLELAVRCFELGRGRVSHEGLGRVAFAAKASPHEAFSAHWARAGKPRKAWEYLETSLARGLLDAFASRAAGEDQWTRGRELNAKVARVEERIAAAAAAGGGSEALTALERERDALLAELAEVVDAAVKRHGAPSGQVFPLARVQAALAPDEALIAWLDRRPRGDAPIAAEAHFGFVLRREGEPACVALLGSGADGAWSQDDEELPRRFRELVARPPGPKRELKEVADLARRLHRQRLMPLAPLLAAHSGLPAAAKLVVVPAGRMAGIPIEALFPDGGALEVSYSPSGTLFASFVEETRRGEALREAPPRSMLVLGDPEYPAATPDPATAPLPEGGALVTAVVTGSNAARSGVLAGDVLLSYAEEKIDGPDGLRAALAKASGASEVALRVWRGGKAVDLAVPRGRLGVQLDARPAPAALRARREVDSLLARGPTFVPLPGTRREAQAVAAIFRSSHEGAGLALLLGSGASEGALEGLRASGKLPTFGYLHFAAHAAVDDREPMRSALILSRGGEPETGAVGLAGELAFDGRLDASAVLRSWKLDAELVALSACGTALGRPSGGEGHLGFSQVLFLAGARSVLLSLWEVPDTATSLLMARFYHNLFVERRTKAAALREAKDWLRGLSQEELAEAVKDLESAEPLRGLKRRPQAARPSPPSERRYEDPFYWAGFVLIGAR
jgi:tetratricopeptide (TPR) repeat protein